MAKREHGYRVTTSIWISCDPANLGRVEMIARELRDLQTFFDKTKAEGGDVTIAVPGGMPETLKITPTTREITDGGAS